MAYESAGEWKPYAAGLTLMVLLSEMLLYLHQTNSMHSDLIFSLTSLPSPYRTFLMLSSL